MRGSGEKAQQLGASAALAESSGSVSSINQGLTTICILTSGESDLLFRLLKVPDVHLVRIYIQAGKHSYKIINK